MIPNGWPYKLHATLEDLRQKGIITAFEPAGEWDFTRSPGPGCPYGIFEQERDEETGDLCYRVWVKPLEEES